MKDRIFHVNDVVDIGVAPDLLPGTPRITQKYVIVAIEGRYAKVCLHNHYRLHDVVEYHWGYMGRGFTLSPEHHNLTERGHPHEMAD